MGDCNENVIRMFSDCGLIFSEVEFLLSHTLGHVLYLQTNNGISVLFSRSDAEDFEYRTLEEKIRTCQEQLQLLIECRDRLAAMITFQKKLNEKERTLI